MVKWRKRQMRAKQLVSHRKMAFFVDGPLNNDGDAEETSVPNNRNKKIIGRKLDSKFN